MPLRRLVAKLRSPYTVGKRAPYAVGMESKKPKWHSRKRKREDDDEETMDDPDWTRGTYNGQSVFVRKDTIGNSLVTIRYKNQADAKTYNTGASKVTVLPSPSGALPPSGTLPPSDDSPSSDTTVTSPRSGPATGLRSGRLSTPVPISDAWIEMLKVYPEKMHVGFLTVARRANTIVLLLSIRFRCGPDANDAKTLTNYETVSGKACEAGAASWGRLCPDMIQQMLEQFHRTGAQMDMDKGNSKTHQITSDSVLLFVLDQPDLYKYIAAHYQPPKTAPFSIVMYSSKSMGKEACVKQAQKALRGTA
jgi:hypothetical protein